LRGGGRIGEKAGLSIFIPKRERGGRKKVGSDFLHRNSVDALNKVH